MQLRPPPETVGCLKRTDSTSAATHPLVFGIRLADVFSWPTIRQVVCLHAVFCIESVLAFESEETVFARATNQSVVAAQTEDCVVALPATQDIRSRGADGAIDVDHITGALDHLVGADIGAVATDRVCDCAQVERTRQAALVPARGPSY